MTERCQTLCPHCPLDVVEIGTQTYHKVGTCASASMCHFYHHAYQKLSNRGNHCDITTTMWLVPSARYCQEYYVDVCLKKCMDGWDFIGCGMSNACRASPLTRITESILVTSRYENQFLSLSFGKNWCSQTKTKVSPCLDTDQLYQQNR